MDRIIFNDNEYVEETYALNPCGVFGEDVGEWTLEEFCGSGCEQVYMEEKYTIDPNDSILLKWAKWGKNRKEAKLEASKKRQLDMIANAPLTATVINELKNWEAVPRFLSEAKHRVVIVNGVLVTYKILSKITHEIMFQQHWGRFPADMKAFYEYVFEMPKELSKEDIKKFKNELKKLHKDTKWLTGKAGNEFITPKERKTVELMNDQLKDLLTWRMIPNDVNKQKERRVHDRLVQFIETSYEFLEMIHSDMVDTKTKNRMKDARK